MTRLLRFRARPVFAWLMTGWLIIGSPGTVAAQHCEWNPLLPPDPGPFPPVEASRASGHLTVWTINAALGGLTAGAFRALQGEPVWNALLHGSIGGTVTYGGKWISGQQWCGSGFVGREMAAIGASMVANAADGRPPLERVVLPIGPVQLHVDRSERRAVHAKIDVFAAVATGYALTHPDMKLNWPSTLSAGTAVFEDHSSEATDWNGRMVGGVITIRRTPGSRLWRRTLAHEQVHVAQHDFSSQVWGDPLESWILGRVPGGDWVHRRFDLGLDFLIWGGAHLLLPDSQRAPWEREAYFLSRYRAEF